MTDTDQPRRAPARSRAAFWGLLAVLVAYLVGSYGTLLLAAVHAGDAGAFLDPGLDRLGDPKDIPLGPDSLWNPLVWIFGLCRLLAWLVYPLVFVTLAVGAVSLAHAWRRGDRGTVARLGALTGIWLALAVIAASPYGKALLTWLID